MDNLTLSTKNTWCPGCGNFAIQNAFKEAVSELDTTKVVLVSGIGCHGKMFDYMNLNGVYALHGRTIPIGTGIKIGNRDLNVVCMVGDGDTYDEGMSHFIHAAKRNSDITVIVHDNRVFALTVNQPTATSPKGYIGSTSPNGTTEEPINPLDVSLTLGATFVARGYSGKPQHLKRLISEGMKHKGFSFIEVLQPCVAWHNTYSEYNERCYEMEEENFTLEQAKGKAREWNYNNDSQIPLGIFYKINKPTNEEQLKDIHPVNIDELLEECK